jgi:hypothetical protein
VSTVTAAFWHRRQKDERYARTPFSGTDGELLRIRAASSGRWNQSYRSWHERGTKLITVSAADLLAYIVGLTIILFLWLHCVSVGAIRTLTGSGWAPPSLQE